MEKNKIHAEDKGHLRELAKKQQEYAALPIMKERSARWYRHNDLKGDTPMIHFETWTCEGDLLPPFQCTSDAGRRIELQLQRELLNHEHIGDDRVVSPWFTMGWHIDFRLFDLKIDREYSKDSEGRALGHQFKHPITNLLSDRALLKSSHYTVDREGTMEWKALVEDTIGDILPVRMGMGAPGISLTQHVVHLMGMEAMIFAMMDYPEAFHHLMGRILEEHQNYLRWMEKENLLFLNNGNNGVAQGTFGFTKDLPGEDAKNRALRTTDLWGYMDSQETVSVSPVMFESFFFPYYQKAAENFGLLNYGCCEPVHSIWDSCISKISNLRKVSISPWCEEEYMGEVLRGSNVVYHRKPSPNYIGVGRVLDEDAYRKHILKTIRSAKGCKLEFSFRDIYSLGGDLQKPRQAIRILRELIESNWY